ncbi:MAG: hypothetical protein [Microviridae sp.]|nr:MAG: hypothetical protein [Microviridae sp.]
MLRRYELSGSSKMPLLLRAPPRSSSTQLLLLLHLHLHLLLLLPLSLGWSIPAQHSTNHPFAKRIQSPRKGAFLCPLGHAELPGSTLHERLSASSLCYTSSPLLAL